LASNPGGYGAGARPPCQGNKVDPIGLSTRNVGNCPQMSTTSRSSHIKKTHKHHHHPPKTPSRSESTPNNTQTRRSQPDESHPSTRTSTTRPNDTHPHTPPTHPTPPTTHLPPLALMTDDRRSCLDVDEGRERGPCQQHRGACTTRSSPATGPPSPEAGADQRKPGPPRPPGGGVHKFAVGGGGERYPGVLPTFRQSCGDGCG